MSLKINYNTAMRLIAKYEKKLKKINKIATKLQNHVDDFRKKHGIIEEWRFKTDVDEIKELSEL